MEYKNLWEFWYEVNTIDTEHEEIPLNQKSMPTENRLLNEIKKLVNEFEGIDFIADELSEAIYDLTETAANDYYNQMKVNKEEEGTTSRFNHWAINHFKKVSL